jgi:uncharacterized protein
MANPSTGRFCWHELGTTDLTAATRFYGELLGWTFRDNPSPAGGTYRVFSLGETMVGGAMVAPAGVPSGWLVYVAVDDTDSATRKVVELGGKIMVPATTVPEMLRFACASDPQGAAFGILQPLGAGAQQHPYEGPARPGTFCWASDAWARLSVARLRLSRRLARERPQRRLQVTVGGPAGGAAV